MISRRIIMTGIAAVLLAVASGSYAAYPSHDDRSKVSDGCGSCHAGHGRKNTPMLRRTVPELCYGCHSSSGRSSSDIQNEMRRRYRHPVDETSGYHRANETLPSKSPADPRHVSCLDCHDPHLSEPGAPTKGVSGAGFGLKAQRPAERVTTICYKCHADSANRPFRSPNTLEEFDPSNASYHPVEKNARVRSVSLMPKVSGEKMECSHCHVSHGSDYQYLLRFPYNTADGPESQTAYQLCYSCHQRESILSDRSFRQHRKHVVFAGASCRTCHTAHGSRNNSSLISFNMSVVSPNRKGMLQYIKTGREADCFLSCHGVDHSGNSIERRR